MSTPEKDRLLAECHAQESRASAKRMMFFGLVGLATFVFCFLVARALLNKFEPVELPTHEQTPLHASA